MDWEWDVMDDRCPVAVEDSDDDSELVAECRDWVEAWGGDNLVRFRVV